MSGCSTSLMRSAYRPVGSSTPITNPEKACAPLTAVIPRSLFSRGIAPARLRTRQSDVKQRRRGPTAFGRHSVHLPMDVNQAAHCPHLSALDADRWRI